eukprot:gene25894-28217_t
MLERMANAFFQAVPGSGAHPSVPAPWLPAATPPSDSPVAPVSTGALHAPAIAGVGLAPPSIPAPPPTPITSRIVPVIPLPSPLGSATTTADPNLVSIADQHRSAEPGLYVAGFRAAQPSVAPKPIPSLGQDLPNDAELRALLGGASSPQAASSQPAYARPQGGGTASAPVGPTPYFLTTPGT